MIIQVSYDEKHSFSYIRYFGSRTFAPSAGFASAHSSLEQSEAKAGGFYKAVVRIPHGCEGKATTAVKIELSEGFVSAQPQPKAGWKVETAKGDYAQSYKIHGKDVTSGVKQVTWSEGELPSDFYDEFVVVGQIAKFDKDTTLSFPVTQFCGTDDSVAWTEIAAEGQNPHDLEHPAPQLRVTAASGADEHAGHGGHGDHGNHGDHAMAPTKVGDLSNQRSINPRHGSRCKSCWRLPYHQKRRQGCRQAGERHNNRCQAR